LYLVTGQKGALGESVPILRAAATINGARANPEDGVREVFGHIAKRAPPPHPREFALRVVVGF
jgi:hypothetical protein